MDNVYLDSLALEYSKLKKDVFIVLIWPKAIKKDDNLREILNNYGEIVYEKEVSLNLNGMIQLMRTAYKGEAWLGDYKNDFEGTRNKARWCYKEGNDLRVFLFESKNDLIRMKDEIRRDMILMGCKSIKDLNLSKIAYR